MKVNLRKANAIQADIRKSIAGIKLQHDVIVNEFVENVGNVQAEGLGKYLDSVKLKTELNAALYDIRSSVGEANAKAGISTILAEIQMVEADLATYTLAANSAPGKPLSEIQARIDKMKVSTPSPVYGERFNTIEVGVLTENIINGFKQDVKRLKRQKQNLQDKLLNINVTTEIVLSDNTVKVLTQEGIL